MAQLTLQTVPVESQNYYRLLNIIFKEGIPCVRHIFDQLVGDADKLPEVIHRGPVQLPVDCPLPEWLKQNKELLHSHRNIDGALTGKSCLTQDQWLKLYPETNVVTNYSANLDLSLIYKLLNIKLGEHHVIVTLVEKLCDMQQVLCRYAVLPGVKSSKYGQYVERLTNILLPLGCCQANIDHWKRQCIQAASADIDIMVKLMMKMRDELELEHSNKQKLQGNAKEVESLPEPDFEQEVVNGEPVMTIIGKIWTTCFRETCDDAYDMKLPARVLIINIITFTKLDKREGAKHDETNLVQLFKELHHERHDVEPNCNNIKELLEIEQKVNHENYSALFVVIMSHGKRGLIQGRDSSELSTSSIEEMFDGDNCPDLIGKPKLFFFQSCRTDDSAMSEAQRATSEVSNASNSATGPQQKSLSALSGSLHVKSDIITIHSAVDGYPAQRTTKLGSFCIRTFVFVVSCYADQMHLTDMVAKMNYLAARLKVVMGNDQRMYQCFQCTTTLRKSLYLCRSHSTVAT